MIIDDPIKAEDAASDLERAWVVRWFSETLITRLDDKGNDVIVTVMQRLHVDDLAGHLLGTGHWEHLNLPMIATKDEAIPIGDGEIYHRVQMGVAASGAGAMGRRRGAPARARPASEVRDIVGLYVDPPAVPWCCPLTRKARSKRTHATRVAHKEGTRRHHDA